MRIVPHANVHADDSTTLSWSWSQQRRISRTLCTQTLAIIASTHDCATTHARLRRKVAWTWRSHVGKICERW